MVSLNKTIQRENQFDLSTYEANKDIIWPTTIGIFVALALGWMVCRYKCSSKEPAPNLIQCCPKSLCKLFSLCFTSLFNLCQCCHKAQEQQTTADISIPSIRERSSNASIFDNSRSSFSQQSPPMLIIGNKQLLSVLSPKPQLIQPKRHPLRQELGVPPMDDIDERKDELSPWTFQTVNSLYHEQIDEIRRKASFYNI